MPIGHMYGGNMTKNNTVEIIKKITGTFFLPVAMYLIMMAVCYSNGKMYYGTWSMWRVLIVDIAISVTCAMGIGIQLKNGRMDFSGGAIMLLAAILAGNISKEMKSSPILLLILCIIFCLILSLLVALIYIFGRLPIIIATIGMALLYEATTCYVFNGSGITLVANLKLKIFSTYPMVLIPFLGAVLVYAFYSKFTVVGKQALLLANNQQSAVNIGLNEKWNIIITYLYSGLIFGFATCIYVTVNKHGASYSSLSTIGELFNNILPVFIGFMLAKFCGDTIGTIVGSVTLCLMSFGLSAVLEAERGAALSLIITGVFLLVINAVAGQGNNIKKMMEYIGKSLVRKVIT